MIEKACSEEKAHVYKVVSLNETREGTSIADLIVFWTCSAFSDANFRFIFFSFLAAFMAVVVSVDSLTGSVKSQRYAPPESKYAPKSTRH